MFFSAEVFDITNDPIAVGLLGAVRVMMITKYLADLVHKLKAWIGSEFAFVFHDISDILLFMEISIENFPFYYPCYNNTWKIVCFIRAISGKFSIYCNC